MHDIINNNGINNNNGIINNNKYLSICGIISIVASTNTQTPMENDGTVDAWGKSLRTGNVMDK